jgi:hypothetical protein
VRIEGHALAEARRRPWQLAASQIVQAAVVAADESPRTGLVVEVDLAVDGRAPPFSIDGRRIDAGPA